jgi:branched-chain amino acid transport system substrate-binding protein
MWDQLDTNQQAGAIWPNDPDGNAWGDPETGFAPVVAERGYSITDPGHYENGTQDFSAQISTFSNENAEILLGVPIPPDFTTFWQQAKQQGYAPKIATIGKALLFPSSVEALGEVGHNLGTEVWWHPTAGYQSSLTGQSAQDLADAYEQATGGQWTQPLGFIHALFEVVVAAVDQAGSVDGQAVVDSLAGLQVSTIVGDLDWTGGPVPNVAKTALAGGQWRQTGGGEAFELVVVENQLAPQIPLGGEVEELP